MVFNRNHSDKVFSYSKHTQHTASIKGENVDKQYTFSVRQIFYVLLLHLLQSIRALSFEWIKDRNSQVLIGQYFLQIFNNQKYCDPAGDYPVSKR